jgi:hypothetical protein
MKHSLPWDDLKVCFGINNDRPFDRVAKSGELPKGWEVCETGISGAAGYYVLFRVSVMPTLEDAYKVKVWLRKIGAMRKS